MSTSGTCSPTLAKWLQVGPFCAGSLLVEQISGRSARMFSSHSLLVWVIQMLGRNSARAVLLLNAGLISKRREVISFSPIGSRSGHSAADLMRKTCAASAAQLQVSTDPAQKMCPATGVRQRPATIYQQVSCRSNTIKAYRGKKKRGITLDLCGTRSSHRHGAFHARKAPVLRSFCLNARQ